MKVDADQRYRNVRAKVRIIGNRYMRQYLRGELDYLPGVPDIERREIIRAIERANTDGQEAAE